MSTVVDIITVIEQPHVETLADVAVYAA